MPRSSLPMTSTSGGRSRWRAVLATAAMALLAGAGLASAAPAAAEEVDVSTLEITVTDCGTYGGQGLVNYVVRDSNPFYRDFIWITDATDAVVHEATYLDGTEFEADVDLDPGSYTIRYSVEHETGATVIDVQTFTIGACPDVGVSVAVQSCSTDRDGVALAMFTGLIPGFSYGYSVVGPDFLVGGPMDEVGETEEIELVGLPPGNYYVTIDWIPLEGQEAPVPVFDWTQFAVEPCQPQLSVTITQCTDPGGTGSATIGVTGLLPDIAYTLTAPDGSSAQLVGDASGTATRSYASLAPGRSYAVAVSGLWELTVPYEEPPFVGGGNFTPLGDTALTAAADLTLQPCPPAAAGSDPVGLAASGPGASEPLLGWSMLLGGLGAAALVAAVRIRRRA